MKSNILTTTFLLVFISVGYFATDIYLPSLPVLMDYFQATERQTQMTMFSYMISFSFTPLFFGPVSDHIGRKKVIMFGLLVALAATIGCYFAQSIHWMIAGRFVQGIGTGAILIASRAMVVDLFTGKDFAKQISYITMYMPLVLALAPTIGGVLQEGFGWHSVFLFLIYYLLILTVWMMVSEETLEVYSTKPISQIFVGYWEVLNNHSFMISGMGMVIATIGMFAYLTASPFLFQDIIGLSPAEYGALALYIGAVIMTTSYINARLLHFVAIETLIWVGAGCMLLAGLLMLTFHMMGILTTWTLLVPTLIYFSCMPLYIANSASKAISYVKRNFGAANGLLTTVQFLAGALGSLIFSLIPEENALPLGVCFLILGVLALVNTFFACKHQMEKAHE